MNEATKKPMVFDAKISERRILIVPTHTIRHTPYNPANRTKEGEKLRRLITAITERGLIYPILITADRDVIDGNRRLAACRALGYKEIECIISSIDRDEAFTVVNTTAVPIGGKGWLEIGMGNGHLPDKIRQQYDELFNLVGSYGVKLLIDQNLGLNILGQVKTLCSLDSKYDISQIIILVATHRLTNKVNVIIRSTESREEKVATFDKLLHSIK